MADEHQGLHIRNENAVRWIVIDREDRGNSLTPGMRNAIIDAFASAHTDHAVRAVVLTAIGKRFCTGADIVSGRSDGPRPDPAAGDTRHMISSGAQRLFRAIWECEKPVVCGLNGTAAGIGAHMALACDLVVAARSAKLIEVFTRRGLVPDGGGTYLLPRLVGPQKAKELMFFADDVTADDALRLGLVNRVVDDGALEDAVREWADRLAAGPTRAYAFTKYMVNRSLDGDIEAAFNAEASFVEINRQTEDMAEGMKAFVERRTPEFRGR
jgi:2-(1,2-epoxy-1,2-dihydrophenyl)acetyl-CoA isomerase